MVSEPCSTVPMPGKSNGSPSPLPGKGDGPLALMPSEGGGPSPVPCKGGGPPLVPRKGVGPPPLPPGGVLLGANNAKKASTRLKRSPKMGKLLQQLRRKMEGASIAGKSSHGRKKGAGSNGRQSMADALAELTKRSLHYKKIEEDVKNHGKSVKEMQAALIAFQTKDMDTLLKFYHQMEFILDVLTDESQVLVRFEGFPVKKLEALRMAAVLYKKLSGILSELQNWKFDLPLSQLLDRVESYFNKVRRDLEALDCTKDNDEKMFQSHNIHFDFSILVKIKEAMVDVSSNCIELALKERREAKSASSDQLLSKVGNKKKKVNAKLLWRTFQFAFKVYTFAAGQDERAERLTDELAKEINDDPMED